MIIDMPNTRTREIAHKIEQLHEERGESATGRVLTLLIATEDADLEHALEIANSASREHPCRVIAVVPDTNPADQSGEGEPNAAEVAAEVSASRDNPAVDLTDGPNDPNDSNLNAQVRFGADAGAGEIIILRPRGGLINHPDTLVIPLLVPDAPVVAWWPTTPPSNPAKDLMGAMARSRITDALHSNNPEATIERLRRNWTPEDIDLSWTRLTVWRAMLASMLDQPPHLPITAAKVTGKRFHFYRGLGCRLERSIIAFFMDTHSAHGYTEIFPPFIANKDSMTGTGQLPKFAEDMYKLEGLDYYLIPTAEVPVPICTAAISSMAASCR